MKKRILFVLAVLMVLTFIGIINTLAHKETIYTNPIRIGGKDLMVQIADTSQLRTKGLSGRKELPPGNGMLFIFPSTNVVSFWMPDMYFPIDIIFIRDKKVTHIEHNVPNFPAGTPLEDLPHYSSLEPINMVIEVPAGWTKINNIDVGSLLET